METLDPSTLISDSRKITDIFGYWPTFHDAEVIDLQLSIADGEPWIPGSQSPVLEMLVYVFEMTKDLTPDGYFVLTKHNLVRLQFANVQDLQLSDFWFQNCIFELTFSQERAGSPQGGDADPSGAPSLLSIEINASVGLSGQFKCRFARVLSVEPCDDSGKPIGTSL